MQTLETATTPRASDFAPFLSVRSVSKRFGDHEVLRNLDLTAHEGEMVAIVGKSGCGKSTLLRLLAGLEKPTEGTIAVESDSINGRNRAARLMFQDSALLPWETVLENVALAAPDRTRRRELAREALRQVGLAHRAKDWPAILSGGQRQRIALARALASEARLILFDEPLGALDALTRLEMQNLIERLWRKRGFTAILVTHECRGSGRPRRPGLIDARWRNRTRKPDLPPAATRPFQCGICDSESGNPISGTAGGVNSRPVFGGSQRIILSIPR
jgi:sulfonate transport system ATP-binding protein